MKALRQIQFEDEASLKPLHIVSPMTVSPVRRQTQAKPLTALQKWSYCLLAVAVAFCAMQALRCGIVSGLKISSLLRQQMAVAHTYKHAQTRQAYLQDKITLYSTSFGIEEMARERLGLVGEDEILVRLYPVATAQAAQ